MALLLQILSNHVYQTFVSVVSHQMENKHLLMAIFSVYYGLNYYMRDHD